MDVNRETTSKDIIVSSGSILNSLEDSNDKVSGHCEAVLWNCFETKESTELSAHQTDEEFQAVEITVPGMLGWLTGQRH
jgi:hypothetical protein